MSLREPLAAALRLLRVSQGLSQEDLHNVADAKHIHNLEYGKTGISLEMLESLTLALGTTPIALIALATKFQNCQSKSALLADLDSELTRLEPGITDGMHAEFQDGKLITHPAGKRTSKTKIDAVLECKTEGMSRKQASEKLGIPQSTLNRLWKLTT